MSLLTRQRNFDTLIVAGVGAIGSSMISLGCDVLPFFKKVILVDLDAGRFAGFRSRGFSFVQGSVEDSEVLAKVTDMVEGKGLLVNLCADVDNVLIRRMLAPRDLAYVDSCAGAGRNPGEHLFSSSMEYALTPVESRCPQWLCWGINPGMVEIIVRRIMRETPQLRGGLDVTVYEHDQLEAPDLDKKIAVGWCPSAFIEEMMLFPTLEIRNGLPREDCQPGARRAMAFWQGDPIASRIVAHEDIWNMGMIGGVKDACFVYGLHPLVMGILDRTPREAEDVLQVPPANVPVCGLERVAVRVGDAAAHWQRTLCWQTDHQQTWKEHGINAVQLQTALSMLLAVLLLQQTRYGRLAGTYCAADLPICAGDWQEFERIMPALGMAWEDGDHLDLRFQRM
ncbi:MAG: hypothetical protein KKA54_08540 [Proteobacteria bacterium]|nr:hypothetical protein [Pseudomonadota bacterium]MBU0966415.1 hypothetical protein [Pseudomonadota bacterium]